MYFFFKLIRQLVLHLILLINQPIRNNDLKFEKYGRRFKLESPDANSDICDIESVEADEVLLKHPSYLNPVSSVNRSNPTFVNINAYDSPELVAALNTSPTYEGIKW